MSVGALLLYACRLTSTTQVPHCLRVNVKRSANVSRHGDDLAVSTTLIAPWLAKLEFAIECTSIIMWCDGSTNMSAYQLQSKTCSALHDVLL